MPAIQAIIQLLPKLTAKYWKKGKRTTISIQLPGKKYSPANTKNPNKSGQEQYRKIAENCEQYLQEYGYTPGNTDISMLLSDIYAYQLNLPDSANRVLEKSTSIRRLNQNTLSVIKSKRADLLTFTDNIWEATILYTQIEKSNPNNNTGYEAKLKKAWLAYYAGDLIWAKAQFDVLKGATTKLISNDAIKMSHFINMNYGEEQQNQDLEKLAKPNI